MLKRSTFVSQIPMYFAVIDAYFSKGIKLELCDIRAIHFCLNTGLQYFAKGSDNGKKIKHYKVLLKSRISELERVNGSSSVKKIRIKNIDIQELFFQLSNQQEDSSLLNKLEVQPLHT